MSVGMRVEGLSITGPLGTIVTRFDLEVAPGGTVAVVGESGSGKSMSAKAITGLLPRGVVATGRLTLGGESVDLSTDAVERLRGSRIGLLLQNPFTSLSPVHRCGEQIAEALPRARRTRDEVVRRLAEVDLPERVADRYPFELSGGMRQRVALAASLAADPDVLIGDEPTTALDVTTQRGVLDLIARIQRDRGMAFVLITHDLGLARQRAERILVMYAGRLVESGSAAAILDHPRHPYTEGLRGSDPPIEKRLTRLPSIPGSVPRAYELGEGCPFAPRCPRVGERCWTDTPVLEGPGEDLAACWFPLGEGERIEVAGEAAGAASSVSGDDLVRVSGAVRRFHPSTPAALDDVSIRVGSGESVGIVGESGSGKTTLARCIVGLERLDSGSIEWAIPETGPRRAQIVFQDPTSALNPAMTVGAALAEALKVVGREDTRVEDLLDQVGLPASYARRRPQGLSGGELQRVSIARALAPSPRLLVCDEPVSSLDVSVQAQILNVLNDLHSRLGLSLLFITHDLAVVRQVADRVYVMHDGRVVEEGEAGAIIAHPRDPYTRELFASVPGR